MPWGLLSNMRCSVLLLTGPNSRMRSTSRWFVSDSDAVGHRPAAPNWDGALPVSS